MRMQLGVDDASRGGPAYLRLTARAFHDTPATPGSTRRNRRQNGLAGAAIPKAY